MKSPCWYGRIFSNYGESYSRFTANAHKAYCYCGEYIIESHDFTFKLGKNTCKHCGYATEGTVPGIKDSVDDDIVTGCSDVYYIPNEEDE